MACRKRGRLGLDTVNCKSRGKPYSLYYQPQPTIYNHRQQYRYDIKIRQDSSKNDYDMDKGDPHGMIHSEISTPKKTQNAHNSIGR